MPETKTVMIFLIMSLGVLLLPKISWAAPAISGVSGNLNHGSQITIFGTGFGSKSPVAPMIWDNGSGRSSGQAPTAGGWQGGYPQGLAGDNAVYNMQYRTAGSFRNVNGPHSLNSIYFAGAGPGYNGYGEANGINPNVWYEFTVGPNQKIFASCYWRLDPDGIFWDAGYPLTNIKNFIYGEEDGPLPSNFDVLITYPYYLGGFVYSPLSCGGSQYCEDSPGDTRVSWVKTEIQMLMETTNGTLKMWDNGTLVIDATGDCSDLSGTTRSFTFGAYWEPRDSESQPPAEPFSNDYRYFADLYLDNTWARVQIGNQNTWPACTVREMQIPSAWANGQITATINQGSFTNGQQAYLYVVDSNGNVNANGYPITIGGSGFDTTPPAAPTGVMII